MDNSLTVWSFFSLFWLSGKPGCNNSQNIFLYIRTSFFVLLTFYSLSFFEESLSWTIKQPDSVYRGSPITLEWTISLTKEEKRRADRFSLILLEREKFLYSNQWQIMAVKQYYNGIYQEIDDEDTFDVIPGKDMALKLNNVTDTDASRFRCTFLSSFASPKSIIEVEIEGESLSFVDVSILVIRNLLGASLTFWEGISQFQNVSEFTQRFIWFQEANISTAFQGIFA